MGNSLSTYFTKQDLDEMDQILGHAKQDFAQLFSSVFMSELVVQSPLKENRRSTVESIQHSLQLEAAPIASAKIKVGVLKKRGGAFKSWKKRYFHAMNKADNYEIIYTVGAGGDTPKGKISCFGYRLEAFTDEEKSSYGDHGLKLISNSSTYRRPWLLVAEKEAQRKEWEVILSSACRNTLPPLQKNSRIHDAFQQAFHILRRKYGFFGQSLLKDSELGCLHTFFNQILYRDKLQDYFSSKLKTSNDHDANASNIMALVNEKVLNVATSVWNQCIEYAENNTENETTFSSTSSDNISSALPTTLITADMKAEVTNTSIMAFDRDMQAFEEKFSREISSLVGERVNYVIEDLKVRVIFPFLDQSVPHITEAYNAAISEFFIQLRKTIYEHLEMTSNDENVSGLDAAFLLTVELDKVEISIDCYAPQYILKSQDRLWSWYTECLAGFADMFESSDNLFLLYFGILDSIRDLIRNALFTFKSLINLECEKTRRKVYLHSKLMEVHEKLKNDCKIVCTHELLNLINYLIEITVQESIVVPCIDQVSHMESFSGNFKALVDMELHTEKNILRVVRERVTSTLSMYTDKLKDDIDVSYQQFLSEIDT